MDIVQDTETHSDAPLSQILRHEKHLRLKILTSLKHFCMKERFMQLRMP